MDITAIIIVLLLLLPVVMSMMHINDLSILKIPGYFWWTDDTVGSKVLFCPNCCKLDPACYKRDFAANDIIECCVTKARPYWTFVENSTTRHYLDMEFNITNQIENLLSAKSMDMSLNYYSHPSKNISTFPVSLCQFPFVVEVNLNDNDIKHIENVSCIKHLDTLRLSKNNIQKLKSFTFQGCANLRVLDLSFNKIGFIEPETLNYRPGSLVKISLQGNWLKTMDVTNVVLNFCFYLIDVSGNEITKFTNVLKREWTISPEAGGVIKLHHNSFTKLPDPSILGLNVDVTSLAFRYMIMASYNPWFCDCSFVKYSQDLKLAHKNFGGIETQIICASPHELKGKDLIFIPENQLVCNLTLKDKCPRMCRCFNQPSESRVVINCTSTGRRNMLKEVPDFDYLHIDLSHNSISRFTEYKYLYKTAWIDLSYNKIIVIDNSIFSIENIKVINLKHNKVKSLHHFIQLKDPCKLEFGNITLKCTCDMIWVKHWLEIQTQRKCTGNSLTCKTDKGLADILSLAKDDLCPITDNVLKYVLLSFTLSILFLTFFIYTFTYEIYIIYRRTRFNLTQRSRIQNECEFDIYTSFDVQNDVIRGWIVHDLLKFFENLGYTVCFPPRDFVVGAVHVDQMRKYIRNCRSFIVVLSQGFLDSQYQITEWNDIWDTWKSDSSKNIVIINYDWIQSKDVSSRKLKAFLRLGYDFDFADFEKHLVQNIKSSLRLR